MTYKNPIKSLKIPQISGIHSPLAFFFEAAATQLSWTLSQCFRSYVQWSAQELAWKTKVWPCSFAAVPSEISRWDPTPGNRLSGVGDLRTSHNRKFFNGSSLLFLSRAPKSFKHFLYNFRDFMKKLWSCDYPWILVLELIWSNMNSTRVPLGSELWDRISHRRVTWLPALSAIPGESRVFFWFYGFFFFLIFKSFNL